MPQIEIIRGPFSMARIGEPADVGDRLPDGARQHLLTLRAAAADHLTLTQDFSRQKFEARESKMDAEARIKILTQPQAALVYGGTLAAEDSASVKDARAKLAAATAEMQRHAEREEAASARWQRLATLVGRSERYLSRFPAGATMKPHMSEMARRGSVEAARRRVVELQADLDRVRAAPRPSSEAKSIARRQIAEMAETGRPDVTGLVDFGEPIKLAERGILARGRAENRHVSVADSAPDGLGLMAWLFQDKLVAAVEAEIDGISDDKNALTAEQRAAKEADLNARILEAERVECDLVWASNDLLALRQDADPRAILGIDGPAPKED